MLDIYYLICEETFDEKKLLQIATQYKIKTVIGSVLKQIGEIFNDEKIYKMAKEYGYEDSYVIDYDNKKTFRWDKGIIERLCSHDVKKFLVEGN